MTSSAVVAALVDQANSLFAEENAESARISKDLDDTRARVEAEKATARARLDAKLKKATDAVASIGSPVPDGGRGEERGRPLPDIERDLDGAVQKAQEATRDARAARATTGGRRAVYFVLLAAVGYVLAKNVTLNFVDEWHQGPAPPQGWWWQHTLQGLARVDEGLKFVAARWFEVVLPLALGLYAATRRRHSALAEDAVQTATEAKRFHAEAVLAVARDVAPVLATAEEHAARRRRELEDHLHESWRRFDDARQRAAVAVAASSPAWDDERWGNWSPGSLELADIRVGALTRSDRGRKVTLPFTVSVKEGRGLVVVAPTGAPGRLDLVHAFMTRLLSVTPPGKVKFRFFDPVGLGQSVAPFLHLADHDEDLVGRKVWTEPNHIDAELGRVTEHIEMVIQKYLRGRFESIEEHNEEAGEVAEAYVVPVALDVPASLTEASIRRLTSIVESGPRCGVYPVIVIDPARPVPHGTDLSKILAAATVIVWDGAHWGVQDPAAAGWTFVAEPPPSLDVPAPDEPQTVFSTVLHHVGRAARTAGNVEVSNARLFAMVDRALAQGAVPGPLPDMAAGFDPDDPSTWWSASSADFLSAPLGRLGATGVQCLTLGLGTAQHALVAGLTGSGKSTLLHAVIGNLAMLYSPSELELYLLDFKKGVEFKPYATHTLPHARVVAIESEREFGLSVLRGLDAELTRRGELFRAAKVDDLGTYRRTTSAPLPRALLVIDEFHELFSIDDGTAAESARILDRLVRQGRGFGIHVLLGSQSLSGLEGLGRATIGQIGVRIALQCDERDSMLILAEDNTAARSLTRPGEAIYNASRGTVEGNARFQVVWLGDAERDTALRRLNARALAAGFGREPVVFEGDASADIERNEAVRAWADGSAVGRSRVELVLGEPFSIDDPVSGVLRRQGGANLAIIGPDHVTTGLLASTIVGLHLQTRPAGRIDVLDFGPLDGPPDESLASVLDHLPAAFRLGRRRQMASVLAAHLDEVRRRTQSEDLAAPVWVVVLHQVHRARDLEADSFGTGDDEEGLDANAAVAELLRDGPEVGVHVVATTDSLARLERRVGRSGLRELGLKVGFRMSATDSVNVFDTEAAARLKDHQALFIDEDDARLVKFRPYGYPRRAWLKGLGD